MYNVKDIPAIETALKKVKGEPDFDVLLAKYTGPDTGLVYNDANETLELASEFAQLENGDIVKISQHTGPATGKHLCDDGVIR